MKIGIINYDNNIEYENYFNQNEYVWLNKNQKAFNEVEKIICLSNPSSNDFKFIKPNHKLFGLNFFLNDSKSLYAAINSKATFYSLEYVKDIKNLIDIVKAHYAYVFISNAKKINEKLNLSLINESKCSDEIFYLINNPNSLFDPATFNNVNQIKKITHDEKKSNVTLQLFDKHISKKPGYYELLNDTKKENIIITTNKSYDEFSCKCITLKMLKGNESKNLLVLDLSSDCGICGEYIGKYTKPFLYKIETATIDENKKYYTLLAKNTKMIEKSFTICPEKNSILKLIFSSKNPQITPFSKKALELFTTYVKKIVEHHDLSALNNIVSVSNKNVINQKLLNTLYNNK